MQGNKQTNATKNVNCFPSLQSNIFSFFAHLKRVYKRTRASERAIGARKYYTIFICVNIKYILICFVEFCDLIE